MDDTNEVAPAPDGVPDEDQRYICVLNDIERALDGLDHGAKVRALGEIAGRLGAMPDQPAAFAVRIKKLAEDAHAQYEYDAAIRAEELLYTFCSEHHREDLL